jgi:hypothetical protein
MVQDQWQPIETAPKDGSEFQAWSLCDGWIPRATWTASDSDWAKGKVFCVWEQVDYDGIEGWGGGHELTHWMPLPEAPLEE